MAKTIDSTLFFMDQPYGMVRFHHTIIKLLGYMAFG